jgi:hypothetical protein
MIPVEFCGPAMICRVKKMRGDTQLTICKDFPNSDLARLVGWLVGLFLMRPLGAYGFHETLRFTSVR